MKLTINDKEYIIKLNIRARIKIDNLFGDENIAFEKAKNGDIETILKLCHCCVQDDSLTFGQFIKSYPLTAKTFEGITKLFVKLTDEAHNPLGIPITTKQSSGKKEIVKTDYKELIVNIMSKGYTQKEVLDMTAWDINLIFEADYKKLEREAIHTNAILNIIASALGNKKPIDILGRKAGKQRDITLFKNITEILDRK